MVLAEQFARHNTAALVANKRLLREGWAETIVRVWDRERAAMLNLAERIGPIGSKTQD
jgi:hypothetical protein